jgi:uncharacterized cupin superfamily protein
MKKWNIDEFIKMEIVSEGSNFKKETLTDCGAQKLTGIFGFVRPGGQGGDYHYHENDEHIIIIIEGEGIELVEGKEIPIKAGDVLFVPAGEKHTTINNSNKDLRYIGFLTCSIPGKRDVVDVN